MPTTWDVQIRLYQTWHSLWSDVKSLTWRVGMGKPYQALADETQATLVLDNSQGQYSPQNPASLFYGQALPQARLRIIANGQPLHNGWLESLSLNWRPLGEQTGQHEVELKAVGAKDRLQSAELTLPLLQSVRADQVIAEVLTRIVLPPAIEEGWLIGVAGYGELGQHTVLRSETDYSELAPAVFTFATYGNPAKEESRNNKPLTAWRAIQDATDTERGRFFFARDGKATFYARHTLHDTLAVTATVASTGNYRPTALTYAFGEDVLNTVEIKLYPKTVGTPITLYTLANPITLEGGAQLRWEAMYSNAENLPADGQNVTIGTQTISLGTGAVEMTPFSDRAFIVFRNTGTTPATLSALTLLGDPLIEGSGRQTYEHQDDASIYNFGRSKPLKLDLKNLELLAEAEEIAELALRGRTGAAGRVTKITFTTSADNTANAHQLNWTIGTRLTLDFPELWHNADYHIIGENHTVTEGGLAHRTDFILEPALISRLAALTHRGAATELIAAATADNTRIAQRFTVPLSGAPKKARLRLRRINDPQGFLTVSIHAATTVSNGWLLGLAGRSELGATTFLNPPYLDYPNPTALATSDPLSAETFQAFGTSTGWLLGVAGYSELGITTLLGEAGIPDELKAQGWHWAEFTFPTPPTLAPNTPYWLMLTPTGGNSTDNLAWQAHDAPLTRDLVAWWELNETLLSAYPDAHSTHTLAPSGPVSDIRVGRNNRPVIHFQTTSLYCTTDASDFAFPDTSFTFAAWIKLNAYGTTEQIIMGKGYSYLLSYNPADNCFVWRISGNGLDWDFGELFATALGKPALYTWHFIAAWYDHVTREFGLTLNGATASQVTSKSVYANTTDLSLGGAESLEMERAAFWRRRLSTAEYTALYNNADGLPYNAYNPDVQPCLNPAGNRSYALYNNLGGWVLPHAAPIFELDLT